MFQKKTVDSVIAAFNKAKDDLLALADELSAKSADKHKQADEIRAEAEGHAAESERARRIAGRVHALTQ